MNDSQIDLSAIDSVVDVEPRMIPVHDAANEPPPGGVALNSEQIALVEVILQGHQSKLIGRGLSAGSRQEHKPMMCPLYIYFIGPLDQSEDAHLADGVVNYLPEFFIANWDPSAFPPSANAQSRGLYATNIVSTQATTMFLCASPISQMSEKARYLDHDTLCNTMSTNILNAMTNFHLPVVVMGTFNPLADDYNRRLIAGPGVSPVQVFFLVKDLNGDTLTRLQEAASHMNAIRDQFPRPGSSDWLKITTVYPINDLQKKEADLPKNLAISLLNSLASLGLQPMHEMEEPPSTSDQQPPTSSSVESLEPENANDTQAGVRSDG